VGGLGERIRAEAENINLPAFAQFESKSFKELSATAGDILPNRSGATMARSCDRMKNFQNAPPEHPQSSGMPGNVGAKIAPPVGADQRTFHGRFFRSRFRRGPLFCSDITERQTSNWQLRQAQKMESVGAVGRRYLHRLYQHPDGDSGPHSLLIQSNLPVAALESASTNRACRERSANLTAIC